MKAEMTTNKMYEFNVFITYLIQQGYVLFLLLLICLSVIKLITVTKPTTTKLENTKSASRAINYAKKRAVVKSRHNLDADYAKSQLKATRALYGKEGGIQAHTIIQSFKPEETTP